ncbi:hypothetical protein K440DRAFT_644327 [Wilcoxina mikolae CBS 423.85]|nr:hypothetical protein K440DRAFT_644327 [Wilcoxina mikolae CBS 423.85]
MTLCVTTFVPGYAKIEIQAETNATEPQLGYDPRKGVYNTTAIRNQLGLNPTTTTKNGESLTLPIDTASLMFYDKFYISTVQLVRPVFGPKTLTGLFTVCGIVGLHLLLVGIVFWFYFKSNATGSRRFLDQALQTVGQLHCGETKEFLQYTSDLGDRDVGHLLPAAAKLNTLVEISNQGKIAINCQTTSYTPLQSWHVDDTARTSLPVQRESAVAEEGIEDGSAAKDSILIAGGGDKDLGGFGDEACLEGNSARSNSSL